MEHHMFLEKQHESSGETVRSKEAADILADIAAVQGPIIVKLNEWLASLEGKTFSPEEASTVVCEIRHVLIRAGCQLLYQGSLVSLNCSTTERSKSAVIRLFTIGGSPNKQIYHKVVFPHLACRPAG